jgi:hypothetical protein
MFEAYKVGVTLALNNKVSAALGFIARDFVKTNAEAKALQKNLKEIKLLGMAGAAIGGMGFMGLLAIKDTLKPANEYVHQLNIMNMAGLKQAEIAESIRAAWENTSKVMTTTATGNLKAILDLRNITGSLQEAKALPPDRDPDSNGHGGIVRRKAREQRR